MTKAISSTTPPPLEAALPDHWALRWYHAVVCGFLVTIFLYLCYVPLSHPETWHTLAKGRAGIRGVADVAPLAEGMRQASGPDWGGRVLLWLLRIGGPAYLSFSFAAVLACSLVAWAVLFSRFSGKSFTSLLVVLIVAGGGSVWDGWHGASLAFVGFTGTAIFLLYQHVPSNRSYRLAGWQIVGVAGAIGLWSHAEASFVIGLVWLGGFVVTHWWAARQGRSRLEAFVSPGFQRALLAWECSLLATVLAPEGWRNWQAIACWPDNPYLRVLCGEELVLVSWPGFLVLTTWALWIGVSRCVTRLEPFWWLTAVGATALVAFRAENIVWFIPLMLLSLLAMVRATPIDSEDVRKVATEPSRGVGRFGFTLLCGLFLWIGFCCSPLGAVLGGQTRSDAQILGTPLPQGAVRFLSEEGATRNTEDPLVWAPAYWSDYLHFHLQRPVMVTADERAVPEIVRDDYERIATGVPEWERLTDKYRIGVLVLDKSRQGELTRRLRRGNPAWKIAYEDSQALVVVRQRH